MPYEFELLNMPRDKKTGRVIHYCFDEQPTSAEERRHNQIMHQHAMMTVRHVSPRPKKQVTVVIGSTEMPCDLDLLQRTTNFFENGKPGMAYGLPASQVSLESFMTLYKWMAAPDQIVSPQVLMGVHRAASYLKINVLLDQYNEKFSDTSVAREEIGFYMFIGLHRINHYLPFRKDLRVNRYFLTMIGTKHFLNLWPPALIRLLSSSHICVNSEIEVLLAIIKWVFHDYASRQSYVIELLTCLRFDSIPLEALIHLRDQCKSHLMTQLLYRPEFEIFLKHSPSLNNNVRYCNRRIWIYDEKCDYHHDTHCLRRHFINVDQFLKFQKFLLTAPELHWWERHQLNPYMHSCRNEDCRRLPRMSHGHGKNQN